jgi:alcohol dehydrogenase YqhD (iron-dependent ADH family)
VHDEIAHGAGLAVCFPAYAKYIYKKSPIAFMRFLRLAYQVFEVEPSMDKEKDCLLGIERLVEFFKNLNMPTKMADLGIDKSELEDLSLRVSWNKTRVIEDVIPLTYKEMREIYELMF